MNVRGGGGGGQFPDRQYILDENDITIEDR